MTFEVDVNGRARRVAVEKSAGGTYRVLLDGVPHDIDAARVGVYGLSVLDRRSGGSRDLQVTPASARGEFLVTLSGRTVGARINGTRRPAGHDGAGGDGEQAIIAPMPGRVVRILVAAGDEVAARQPVVVVEAMKMENELRSPKAGRVKEVSVAAGASVAAGRVLVVVE